MLRSTDRCTQQSKNSCSQMPPKRRGRRPNDPLPPEERHEQGLPDLSPNPTAQEVIDRSRMRSRLSTRQLGYTGERKRNRVMAKLLIRATSRARKSGDWTAVHRCFPGYSEEAAFVEHDWGDPDEDDAKNR